MYRMLFVLVISGSLALIGCNTPTSETSQNGPITITNATYAYAFGTPPALVDKLNWGRLEGEERDQARAESMRLGREGFGVITPLLASMEDDLTQTEEPLRVAREIVAEVEGTDAQFLAEQAVGLMLLNHFMAGGKIEAIDPATLVKRDLTDGQQEVVAFATELMIRNENPNASLMASCLQTLEGYWSAEQIQQQARAAAQGAQRYVDYLRECSDCGNKADLGNTPALLERISQGVNRLNALAAR